MNVHNGDGSAMHLFEESVKVVELWGKLSGAALLVQYSWGAGANQVGCQYLTDNQRWSNILFLHTHIPFYLMTTRASLELVHVRKNSSKLGSSLT